MRKCGFVNSLTLCEWRKCWGLSRRVSELGEKVWQTHCFALVLHEIRVGRALAPSYTELSRSGDFSGLLLSLSVCPLIHLLGVNRVFSLFQMKVWKFPVFGKHHCRSSSYSL